MTFAVGDKVLITATRIPSTNIPIPAGTNGEIARADFTQPLFYYVNYENTLGQGWWFADEHLEHLSGKNLMPELDMGLDEIHLAQEIMEGLR